MIDHLPRFRVPAQFRVNLSQLPPRRFVFPDLQHLQEPFLRAFVLTLGQPYRRAFVQRGEIGWVSNEDVVVDRQGVRGLTGRECRLGEREEVRDGERSGVFGQLCDG
jgi:hypothetical protein